MTTRYLFQSIYSWYHGIFRFPSSRYPRHMDHFSVLSAVGYSRCFRILSISTVNTLRYPGILGNSAMRFFRQPGELCYDMGRAYSFVACSTCLIVSHASLPRRSPVPTPSIDTSNMQALTTFSSIHHTKPYTYLVRFLIGPLWPQSLL